MGEQFSWGEFDENGRVCTTCKEWKPYTDYHKHARCPFGHNTVCKSCRKLVTKSAWLEKDYLIKMFERAKSRAYKKGREFSIALSDIVIPDVCPVFGVVMVEGTEYAPSIDRINSDLGYVVGNIQVISKRANLLKNNATVDELEAVLLHMRSL